MKPFACTLCVAILAALAYAAAPAKRPPTLKEEVDDLKARVAALEKAVADLRVAKAPADNTFKVGMTMDQADALLNKLNVTLNGATKESRLVGGKEVVEEVWYLNAGGGARRLYFENKVVVRVVE